MSLIYKKPIEMLTLDQELEHTALQIRVGQALRENPAILGYITQLGEDKAHSLLHFSSVVAAKPESLQLHMAGATGEIGAYKHLYELAQNVEVLIAQYESIAQGNKQ